MGLGQLNFAGLNRREVAIMRLREYMPPEGYYGAFSGGKDSLCIKGLCVEAGVLVDWHFNISGLDPPELLDYIRAEHPDVEMIRPSRPIFKEIVRRNLPLMNRRWCCELIKEANGGGRTVMTGVRWEESVRRRRRMLYEQCRTDGTKYYFHPIIDWSGADVWEYIKAEGLKYCRLYDEGYDRLGCLLCPMATKANTERDMKGYPKYAEAMRRATDRLWDRLRAEDRPAARLWASGDDMFTWWLNKKALKDDSQCVMFE